MQHVGSLLRGMPGIGKESAGPRTFPPGGPASENQAAFRHLTRRMASSGLFFAVGVLAQALQAVHGGRAAGPVDDLFGLDQLGQDLLDVAGLLIREQIAEVVESYNFV